MSTTKRLVFFGTDEFSLPCLQALISGGYQVLAIVTKPDSPKNRGLHLNSPPIKDMAVKSNIKVLQPDNLAEITPELKNFEAHAGILVSYGKLIPQSVIDIFPDGIINVHPSLLPIYRGPSPIESAILNGDKETGVSLMRLTAGMDEGPVYAQQAIKLDGTETKIQLYEKLSRIGADMLLQYLPDILSGALKPVSQNNQNATYSQLIKKADGIIDWHKPATTIIREIRAYAGWPQSRTTIMGKEVIITKAHSVPSKPESIKPGLIETLADIGLLMIYASDGYICVDKLKPAGKSEMTATEFLRGLKNPS